MIETILISVLACLAVNYLLEITRRERVGRETVEAMVPFAPVPDAVPVPEMEANYPQRIYYLQANHNLPNEVVESLQEDITPIRHVFAQVAVARIQNVWTWRCIMCVQQGLRTPGLHWEFCLLHYVGISAFFSPGLCGGCGFEPFQNYPAGMCWICLRVIGDFREVDHNT